MLRPNLLVPVSNSIVSLAVCQEIFPDSVPKRIKFGIGALSNLPGTSKLIPSSFCFQLWPDV